MSGAVGLEQIPHSLCTPVNMSLSTIENIVSQHLHKQVLQSPN